MMAGAGGAMRATGWRATAIGGKQGDWLTQPPYQAFAQRVLFQRTSTRQQLDCATTLLLRSQVNRRTPISDGLSACS